MAQFLHGIFLLADNMAAMCGTRSSWNHKPNWNQTGTANQIHFLQQQVIFFSPIIYTSECVSFLPPLNLDSNRAKFISTSRNDRLSPRITGCDPYDRYALIVHGFNESWAQDLRKSELKFDRVRSKIENRNFILSKISKKNIDLFTYRGGCVICMDYSAYSADYVFLVANLKAIAEILTAKFTALRENNFSSCTAFVFGFSLGARIVPLAANNFGLEQFEKIDCE